MTFCYQTTIGESNRYAFRVGDGKKVRKNLISVSYLPYLQVVRSGLVAVFFLTSLSTVFPFKEQMSELIYYTFCAL